MNRKGFTLVELLVVIVIIGILATLATVALGSARLKARDARRISDVKQIQTALELYYNDAGKYPDALTFGQPLSSGSTVYMAAIPKDPSTTTESACGTTLQGYNYTTMANAVTYKDRGYVIRYCLGGATGDIPAGTHCATLEGISNTFALSTAAGAAGTTHCPYSASQGLAGL